MYYYNSTLEYLIFIIPLIISGYASFMVKYNFNKYSKVKSSSGVNGMETARRVLNYNRVEGVTIERTNGYFTDYFDSRTNKICLSSEVYDAQTISAVSVAAHESGHATQNATGYLPLRFRHFLVPITQFGSNLSMPLIILGFLIPGFSFAIELGIIFFSFSVIFQIVTLPVEFDASRRALESIKATGILNEDEIKSSKKVLKAAAFTYVAATFSAFASLLRLIVMYRNKKD